MTSPKPFQLVVMGVSGCGKSTLSKALSETLQLSLADGDDLHSPQSITKMQSGIALVDEDRWPWLDRIGRHLSSAIEPAEQHSGSVIACSALKRAYRDRIRQWAPDVKFIFLDGDRELIHLRMTSRIGHFMQSDLLDSQLRTLERPSADEKDVWRLSIAQPINALVSQAIQLLLAKGHTANTNSMHTY